MARMSRGMNTLRLQGRSAIVTGANSGIGEAVAMAMAAEGARVIINYVTDKEAADQVVNAIRSKKGTAVALYADVSREEDVLTMFSRACQEFGTIDILVSNAGIQRDASFTDMALPQWQEVIDINLTGGFLCAREAAKEFLRRGRTPTDSPCLGKIIFISSVHEVIPWAHHANYAAAKGGIMLLMKSIAQELAPYKIRVNSISPGAIKTPINRAAWETPEREADLLKLIPYRRIGMPGDVAHTAVWLASDESDYINGTSIYVDGGMTLYPGFATGG